MVREFASNAFDAEALGHSEADVRWNAHPHQRTYSPASPHQVGHS